MTNQRRPFRVTVTLGAKRSLFHHPGTHDAITSAAGNPIVHALLGKPKRGFERSERVAFGA